MGSSGCACSNILILLHVFMKHFLMIFSLYSTLFSALVLWEPLPRRKYIGIGAAVLGVAIMAGFEPHYTACSLNGTGQCMALGDVLALLSGICFAIYLLRDAENVTATRFSAIRQMCTGWQRSGSYPSHCILRFSMRIH